MMFGIARFFLLRRPVIPTAAEPGMAQGQRNEIQPLAVEVDNKIQLEIILKWDGIQLPGAPGLVFHGDGGSLSQRAREELAAAGLWTQFEALDFKFAGG